jgi:hypothetical protein
VGTGDKFDYNDIRMIVATHLRCAQAPACIGSIQDLENGTRFSRRGLPVLQASSAESWLVQQAQYDLAQVDTDRIKVKRLAPA